MKGFDEVYTAGFCFDLIKYSIVYKVKLAFQSVELNDDGEVISEDAVKSAIERIKKESKSWGTTLENVSRYAYEILENSIYSKENPGKIQIKSVSISSPSGKFAEFSRIF